MENVTKGLVALAALTFVIGVLAGLTGGVLMGYPAESFSRACETTWHWLPSPSCSWARGKQPPQGVEARFRILNLFGIWGLEL